ncbi:hypothetical protein BC936DRAFT_144122 [Jimgerdemannia flammicorona]|uniref:Uncharacterized protein n=1 Tax=Jimgerdemannia flammicorona TaxID=994334 RepID=A0A433DCY5_9FUNG|nr:hypothetical protein BC936DRAFT_144122 [Jimgerdemannia flammicorona]
MHPATVALESANGTCAVIGTCSHEGTHISKKGAYVKLTTLNGPPAPSFPAGFRVAAASRPDRRIHQAHSFSTGPSLLPLPSITTLFPPQHATQIHPSSCRPCGHLDLGCANRQPNQEGQWQTRQTDPEGTFYWRATSSDYPGGPRVSIATCDGKTIAKVNKNFADNLVMEGSGRLHNGVLVNTGACNCAPGKYNCFVVLDRKHFKWGQSARGRPLRPFVSIASNDLKPGSKIFVPQIVGWVTPVTGKKHNGCLLVDDTFSATTDHHIDFYSLELKYYKKLNTAHPTSTIDIYAGAKCKLLNYMKK